MIVSFSVGAKSVTICNTLKKSADNVEFHTYKSVGEMIKESKLRHIFFDRIVFSSVILKNVDKELKELNDFIKDYSDSTEVVFIVNPKDVKSKQAGSLFSSIFNSPLYTPVLLSSVTPQTLLELVKSDIIELKTKYYVLDVNKDEGLVSTPKQEGSREVKPQVVKPEKPEKKGFFGGFMGSKKATPKKPEMEESVPEVKEITTEENAEEITEKPSLFNGFGIETGVNSDPLENNDSLNRNLISEGSPVADANSQSLDFSGDSDTEDDLLSIGDFGSQHSDTDFLDADDEKELEEQLAQEEEPLPKIEENSTPSSPEIFEEEKDALDSVSLEIPEFTIPEDKSETVQKSKRPHNSGFSNTKKPKGTSIGLITGVKGCGATQSIVDEAVKLAKKGLNVLIVDLDNKENGILSYIDVKEFYRKKCDRGITYQRAYVEDGVSIVSNGYGVKVTYQEVDRLFNSSFTKNFNVILIDCPADCLYCISDSLIRSCKVLVRTGVDRSDLLATSLALTNRDLVSLEVERFIMNSCEVEFSWRGDTPKVKESFIKEELGFVKGLCLFVNGNWLNQVK